MSTETMVKAPVKYIKATCPVCATLVKMNAAAPLALPDQCPNCASVATAAPVSNDTANVDKKAVQKVIAEQALSGQAVKSLRAEVNMHRAVIIALLERLGVTEQELGVSALPQLTAETTREPNAAPAQPA